MSNKTFKDFAEACWDTHKQVGFKTSSRTGKRVPNCVPKNEEGTNNEEASSGVADKPRRTIAQGEVKPKEQEKSEQEEENLPESEEAVPT